MEANFEEKSIDEYEEYAYSYQIKLADFEGPLDLLLELVKKNKMDIATLKVSLITEQYLEYMQQIDTIDLDRASEFIAMAALLLEIKSKALLPKIEEQNDEDDENTEEGLRRRLEEYKLYKEAGVKMKETETVDIMYRTPDPSVGKPKLVLKDMTKDGLMEALRKLFVKIEQRALVNQDRQIQMDRFTVADKIRQISEFITLREQASFFELFDDDYTKSEIITTFQALLELIKNQIVTTKQTEIFGDIIINKVH